MTAFRYNLGDIIRSNRTGYLIQVVDCRLSPPEYTVEVIDITSLDMGKRFTFTQDTVEQHSTFVRTPMNSSSELPIQQPPRKCECGSAALGSPRHSSWCCMYQDAT